ncbi:MAG: hypothetical protein OIF50_11225, partial [Flavobacteriaceae bacterium]|nr:hypothetical protein [Flavobacteriaceae bacterium]
HLDNVTVTAKGGGGSSSSSDYYSLIRAWNNSQDTGSGKSGTGVGGGSGGYSGIMGSVYAVTTDSSEEDGEPECPEGFIENEAGECVIKPDIIIDSLTGKAKCVYEKLKNKNGNLFKKTIGSFVKDPKFQLILKHGNCTKTDEACVDGSQAINDNIITLIIENNNMPTFEMAATILHEGIHAELWRYVAQYHNGVVNPNDREKVFQYYKHYAEYYGDVFKNNENGAKNTIDHIYMTQHYIKPIAQALRELDNKRFPIDYYKSYAWDGLRAWDPNNEIDLKDDIYSEYRKLVELNNKLCPE